MRIRGPLVTLAAVAALGAGLWLGNVSQQQAPAPQPVAAPITSTPVIPAPTSATPPPAPGFPAQADYVATVPTATGTITLEITVEGDKATAYACDNNSTEVWFRGEATTGELHLAGKDSSGVLDGRLENNAVAGLMTIGEQSWVFTAERARGGGDA